MYFLINQSLKSRKKCTLILFLHILTQKLHWNSAGINKDSNSTVAHCDFSIIFLSRRIVQQGEEGGISPHQKNLGCCSMSRSTCFYSNMLTLTSYISNQLYFKCAAKTDITEWTLLYTSCAERNWKLKHKLIPCREASINNINISLEKWGRGGILKICSNQFAKSTGIQDDLSRFCNNAFRLISFYSFWCLSMSVNSFQ